MNESFRIQVSFLAPVYSPVEIWSCYLLIFYLLRLTSVQIQLKLQRGDSGVGKARKPEQCASTLGAVPLEGSRSILLMLIKKKEKQN